MTLAVIVGMTQLMLGIMGIYLTVRPPKKQNRKEHWLWIGGFGLIGFLGLLFTVWAAKRSADSQAESLRDIHAAQIDAANAKTAATEANRAATEANKAATEAEKQTAISREEALKTAATLERLINDRAEAQTRQLNIQASRLASPIGEIRLEIEYSSALSKEQSPNEANSHPLDNLRVFLRDNSRTAEQWSDATLTAGEIGPTTPLALSTAYDVWFNPDKIPSSVLPLDLTAAGLETYRLRFFRKKECKDAMESQPDLEFRARRGSDGKRKYWLIFDRSDESIQASPTIYFDATFTNGTITSVEDLRSATLLVVRGSPLILSEKFVFGIREFGIMLGNGTSFRLETKGKEVFDRAGRFGILSSPDDYCYRFSSKLEPL